ncbi:PadR family transcriptional regulator [Calderihabitans maritimus]|uniref:Transcriptional regulator, padr family n=1 Tax=Calderihabitans maritimus TaxID=1246530 RepID=A0A1Z5HPD5_9FIRM|nr:helix-turn-helix transcriptional regulator [Calderihabitans maritimus]GAW91392.1 transcriptional regulator, padr family [Calderihabitans maritimus]
MCNHRGSTHQFHGPCCHSHGPRLEGFLIPCLLLLLKDNPAHGYELMERLAELSYLEVQPDPAVVYRHLRRLEVEGMVESRLEPGSGGPARKVYSLTPEGESYLKAWAMRIRKKKASLEGFLADFEKRYPPEKRS